MLFRINAIISYKKGGWSSYAATLDESGHKRYAGGGGPTKEDLREERELFSWPRFIETFSGATLPTAIDVSHISDIKFTVGADGESSLLITENTGVVDDADIKANLVKFAYYTRQVYDPAKVTNSAGSGSINPNTAYNNTYNSLLGYIEAGPPPAPQVPSFENAKSILWDGINEYASSGSGYVSESVLGNPITFSIWFKPVDLTGGWSTCFYVGQNNYGASRVWLSYVNATIQNEYRLPNLDYLEYTLPAAGVWYHYVSTDTRTSGTTGDITLYINGVKRDEEIGAAALGSAHPSYFVQQSRLGQSGGDYMDGHTDEASIWSKAFSQAEVTELYENGPQDLTLHSANVTGSNLVHWWRNGDLTDTASTIYDQVGSLDLTTYGSPIISTDVPS